jgi:hypothetical protein
VLKPILVASFNISPVLACMIFAGKIPKNVVKTNFLRDMFIMGDEILINQFGRIGLSLYLEKLP